VINPVNNIINTILSYSLNSTKVVTYRSIFNILDAIDTSISIVIREKNNINTSIQLNANNNIINSITNVEQIHTSLQKYTQLTSKEIQPGQYPIDTIKNNFRLTVLNIQPQLMYLESWNSNRSLDNLESKPNYYDISIPRTRLEILNAKKMNSFSIPISLNSTNIQIVSALQIVSSLYTLTTITNQSYLISNSLKMIITNGISCNEPTCTMEIVLQNNNVFKPAHDNSRYLNNNINEIETVEIQCSKNIIETKTYICSDGDIVTVPCNGTSSTIIASCRQKNDENLCAQLSRNSIIPSTCKKSSSTNYNITCSCEFNNSKKIDVNYIAIMKSVYTNFNLVYRSNITLSQLSREWYVSTFIGCFILLVCSSIIMGYFLDKKDKNLNIYNNTSYKEYESSKISKKLNYHEKEIIPMQNNLFVYNKPIFVINRETKKYYNDLNKKPLNSVIYLDNVEEVLPQIFHNKLFINKLIYELQHHHRWLGIIYHFSDVFPRTLRIIALITNMLVMMFFQALTYQLINPNISSCQIYKSENTCIQPRSSFHTGESMCQWNKSHHVCSLITPDHSIHIVIFVAIFSAVLITPINCISHWIIKNILSQPTEDSILLISSISTDSGDSMSNKISISEKDFQNKNIIEMNNFIEDLLRYRWNIVDLTMRSQFDRK